MTDYAQLSQLRIDAEYEPNKAHISQFRIDAEYDANHVRMSQLRPEVEYDDSSPKIGYFRIDAEYNMLPPAPLPALPTITVYNPVINGDVAIIPDNFGNADIRFKPSDVTIDDGLITAVYISLFSDARDPETGEGGYWGDSFGDIQLGSLLWTFAREKMTSDLPSRVKAACENALQWLVDNRIASKIDVTVTKTGMYSLNIQIDILKPDDTSINIKYAYNWQNQFAKEI